MNNRALEGQKIEVIEKTTSKINNLLERTANICEVNYTNDKSKLVKMQSHPSSSDARKSCFCYSLIRLNDSMYRKLEKQTCLVK